MELWVLDKDYKSVDIIDTFTSIIWTDRYYGYGDFELSALCTPYLVSILQKGFHLWCKESEHLMIIEEIQIGSSEEGLTLLVSGRSLESILERRIVWNQTILDAPFQDCVEKLLNENVISPSDSKRKIENFIFQKSELQTLAEENIQAQFRGETIYECIKSICEEKKIGFKIIRADDGQYTFSLYEGVDRSYEQILNPYVIFSPNFDNIEESNYLEKETDYKNVVLVGGEGDGSNRKTVEVSLDDKEYTGLERREYFENASDISSTTSSGTVSAEDYKKQLTQRGKEVLSDLGVYHYFDGTVDIDRVFKYRTDFSVGDIVQLSNEYGIESRARIIEMIMSHDSEGEKMYPTLEIIEE